MAFVSLADGIQVVIQIGAGASQYTNTVHATKTDWSDVDVVALVNAIKNAWNGLTTRPVRTGHTINLITCYDLRSENAPVYVTPVTSSGGSYAGEVADKQTAFVVTFRTSRRGRSGRGRWYVGGATEGIMESGTFSSAHSTAVLAWVTACMGAFTGLGWQPVIKSTQQGGQKLTVADPIAITSWEARSLVPGSQNRRNARP